MSELRLRISWNAAWATLAIVVGTACDIPERPRLATMFLAAAKGDEPPIEPHLLDEIPKETETGIHMASDKTLFDLRYWRPPVPGSEKHSAAIMTDVMQMTKEEGIDTVTFHYATSGSGIDLKCLSHPYAVVGMKSNLHHENEKQYALTFDVSGEKAGETFEVVTQGVYWDGFKEALESASTYTLKDPETSDLTLSVAFPVWNLPKWVGASYGKSDETAVVPYPAQGEVQRAKDGSWARWRIGTKNPDTHYKLTWEWKPTAEPN